MHYRVYIEEPPTLLDDLLEDSARRYHRHCAVIQRAFHERWLEALGEEVGRRQIERPDAAAALVEAWAREKLRPARAALRDAQREMIREEAEARAVRDAAIRAYVASQPAGRAVSAAA
jgi:hypothetical protein